MLKKALEPHPHLVPCDIEINRPQYSWTFETIRELKKVYPEDSFTFISGSEGFLKIKTWKNYKDLLKSLFFIVIVREPHHKQMVNILMEEERITGRVAFFSYPSEYLSISSTLIRNKIKLNQSIDNYVDKEVKQIMEVNQLYEN